VACSSRRTEPGAKGALRGDRQQGTKLRGGMGIRAAPRTGGIGEARRRRSAPRRAATTPRWTAEAHEAERERGVGAQASGSIMVTEPSREADSARPRSCRSGDCGGS